jgi:uncharacterized Zn-binding protein involved in type VI secretion
MFCTVHGCWPSRPNAQASTDVYVNGIPWHRQSDACLLIVAPTCHGGVLAAGSPDVYINGLHQETSDPVSCGSACLAHSPDVWAN